MGGTGSKEEEGQDSKAVPGSMGSEGVGSSLTQAGNYTVPAELLVPAHTLCPPWLLFLKWQQLGIMFEFPA